MLSRATTMAIIGCTTLSKALRGIPGLNVREHASRVITFSQCHLDSRVDLSTKCPMNTGISKSQTPNQDRQIVGFSLAPALAREVKQEAARRGLSLRKLFEEIWRLYKEKSGKRA